MQLAFGEELGWRILAFQIAAGHMGSEGKD